MDGSKEFYFEGAGFNIDSSITDYTVSPAKVLPNTSIVPTYISDSNIFKKGNVHVYYIVYTFNNYDEFYQDNLQGATFTTEFDVELENINEVQVSSMNVGDMVIYNPPEGVDNNVPTDWTGFYVSQTIHPEYNKLWRVIKKNDDGTIEIVSEYTSYENIFFVGPEGYRVYVDGLNNIANLYIDDNYIQSARHMGYNGQIGSLSDSATVITAANNNETAPWTGITINNDYEAQGGGDMLYQADTGTDGQLNYYDYGSDVGLIYQVYKNYRDDGLAPLAAYYTMPDGNPSSSKVNYWLASRIFYEEDGYWDLSGRIINKKDRVDSIYFWNSNYGYYNGYSAVRVILTLKSGLNMTGNGSLNRPWKIN